MKDLFLGAFDHACAQLRGDEILLANFSGERSDFIRFNHGRVRQPLSVQQAYLTLRLVQPGSDGARHDSITLTLSGTAAEDQADIGHALCVLRDELDRLPVDPYLLYSREATQSSTERPGSLPQPAQAIDTITSAAAGADLVGILSTGPVFRGFASSLGASHWHAVDSFLFDWSVFAAGDKAAKSLYAAQDWTDRDVAGRIAAAREQLPFLARPARTIEPGSYRAYICPAALDELLWMLNWGGVSAKSQRTRQSPLQKLVDGEAQLAAQIHLRDHIAGGLAPAFDNFGFTRPASTELICAGRHSGSMVSPRTAQEYGIASNGAVESESMQAMELSPGELPAADALAALDTGVYVSNFHYLNWSDRRAGRITGLTRFATYWVEDGQIVAPLAVMRFDDSVYRMLGDQLESLTQQTEWILNAGTYGGRAVETSRVPGALLQALRLTL